MTDLKMTCIAALESDNIRLSGNLQLANEKLYQHQMHEESFKNDDLRVKFYTGLPTFAVLLAVFQLLEAYVPHTSKNALPKFQEMVVTLMRLRLGVPLQDIAYRWVDCSSVHETAFLLGLKQGENGLLATRWAKLHT